jgi:transcription-repair coupling factor (superfamily II helicase)
MPRVRCKSHAFSPDNYLTREFEAAFEYDETRISSGQSMKFVQTWNLRTDGPAGLRRCRLRKNRGGARAAFKSVLDNKQVTVLT